MNKNYTRFTNEQIMEMRKTSEGIEAIIKNSRALVAKKARGIYMDGYALEDKMQLGYEGLFKAIQTFDMDKANNTNTDFYTYATRAVVNTILNAASKFKSARSGYNKEEDTYVKLLSLDYKENNEEDSIVAYVADETVDVYKEATEDEWAWMLSFLTQREYECLYSYFRKEQTFEEIGNNYGVSKQAARKAFVKATEKLQTRFSQAELAEKLGL